MSTPTPRNRNLTLVGMPVYTPLPPPLPLDTQEPEPFPLTPYRDVHVYTPSRERTVTAQLGPTNDARCYPSTILPPPPDRPLTTAPPSIVDPSMTAQMVATGIVFLLIAAAVTFLH